MRLEETNNDAVDGDAEISRPASHVRSVVVRAREDREIARQVTGLVVYA